MAERPQPGSPTTFDDPASLLEQDQILAEKCLHLQQQFSTQSLQLRGGGALPSALLYSMLLHAGYGNTAFGNGMAPYQPFYCPGQYIAPNPFAAAYNPNLWDSQELQGFGAENYFQNSPQESKPIITMAGMQPESDQRAQEPRPPAVDRKKNGYQANATKANRANTKEAAQIVQKRASAPPAVQRVANAHQNDTPTPKREDHTKNGAKWTTSRVVLTSESRTTDLKGISMPKPIAFGKWVPGYWVYLEEMQKVGEIMNATGLLVNSVAYILPAKATVDLNSDTNEHWARVFTKLGSFDAKGLASAAQKIGCNVLERAARHANRVDKLEMVLLPLLSENHWRLVVFTRARTLRLYNPRGHPGHSPSEPYEVRSLLRTYAEVARLIFADCDPSRSAKIKARTQLQDEVKFRWDYAGVQRDRWSCGFWVFAFLFLLSLTIPKAIHGQNNDAASGRVFTHNSGAALGRVLRAEAETLINPIRLLTNAEDRVKVLKQVYLGLHREKT